MKVEPKESILKSRTAEPDRGVAGSVQVSVVIGTYNRLPFLKKTLKSVRDEMRGIGYEILIVDGGSDDGTVAWLAKQKDVITIVQHNHGQWEGKSVRRRSWGYFMNLGFKCAQGKYVCMLSDDCLVVPGAIRNGIRLFEEETKKGNKVGAVAFYWRNYPEQQKYWVGLTLGDRMFVNHGLFLREAIAEVGYADEEIFEFYHADGDLCLKLWQHGYVCQDSPDSYIEHCSHANRRVRASNLERQEEDWKNYLSKWSGIYYDEDKKDFGSWVEKEFTDPNSTAKGFDLSLRQDASLTKRVLKKITRR